MNGPGLGPCCVCERVGPSVRNVLMLSKRSPIPGRGWGCFACGLPEDGASAVLCDACMPTDGEPMPELRFACRGYPDTDGRVPYAELEGEFHHDRRFHPEMADGDPG